MMISERDTADLTAIEHGTHGDVGIGDLGTRVDTVNAAFENLCKRNGQFYALTMLVEWMAIPTHKRP